MFMCARVCSSVRNHVWLWGLVWFHVCMCVCTHAHMSVYLCLCAYYLCTFPKRDVSNELIGLEWTLCICT